MRFLGFAMVLGVCACTTASRDIELTDAEYFEESKSAITEMVITGREHASRCSVDGHMVTYVGKTDIGLYTCLYEAAAIGVDHLTITSSGGPVVFAIPAADIVANNKMTVSILGYCASSCGNYIASSADRLNILPFSLLSVHGVPTDFDISALSEAMKASGASEKQIRQSLAPNIRTGRFEVELHNAFRDRQGVGSDLYDPGLLGAAQQALGESPLLYLSLETATSCMPTVQIEAFWEPNYPEDFQLVQRLFPKSSIGEYSKLVDRAVCQ